MGKEGYVFCELSPSGLEILIWSKIYNETTESGMGRETRGILDRKEDHGPRLQTKAEK